MQKAWLSIPTTNIAMIVDATALGGSIGFAGPGTILRMVGEYIICNTGMTVTGDAVEIIVGIGIISSDAFAAGVGLVPDPGAEPEYPWMYWQEHAFFFPVGGAPHTPNSDMSEVRKVIDIRSMRKVKPRESLAFIVQYADIAGTPPMQIIQVGIRVLIAT